MRWGGHANGRIPVDQLEYVGIGVRSGQPQYLHPSVAAAWRALQADFKRHKVNLLITEGYRTLELQEAYWAKWQNGTGNPAAYPGTSNHGWATAVDMANYLALPADVRRPLIEARGFSLTTGDRVREPWHIEYVATLAPVDVGVTIPITPEETPTLEDNMLWLKHDSHEVWYIIAPGVKTQRIRDKVEARNLSDAILGEGERARRATSAALTALISRCEASLPEYRGLTATAVAKAVAAEIRADLESVPAATVNELRDRL